MYKRYTQRMIGALLATSLLASPATVFAYEAAPIALSRQATFITEKSVRLNGEGNPNGMQDAMSWFEWGVSGKNQTVYETPRRRLSGSGNTLVQVSADLIGLAPSTQYFYRLVVESGRGKDVGHTTFVTTKARPGDLPELVIVETSAPKVVSESTAELSGYVSPHGNERTEAWFEWGVTPSLEAETTHRRMSRDTRVLEAKITKLLPGTPYFYRIVGENDSGRVYGATRMFVTLGTPPPPPEKERAQSSPTPGKGDGVERMNTTSGAVVSPEEKKEASANFNNSGDTAHGFPGVSAKNRPGDIFALLFKKKATTESKSGSTEGTETNQGSSQIAGVAGSGSALGSFWDDLTGRAKVTVSVTKAGDDEVAPLSPVEYVVTYRYRESAQAKNAEVSVILPSSIIYIGDNTANELRVASGGSGERIYTLPIGDISYGAERSFSILGMSTNEVIAKPEVRASFSYEDATGVHLVADAKRAQGEVTSGNEDAQIASVAGSSGKGVLPDSALEWLLYLASIVFLIMVIRKVREYYIARKEALQKAEEEDDLVLSRMVPGANHS